MQLLGCLAHQLIDFIQEPCGVCAAIALLNSLAGSRAACLRCRAAGSQKSLAEQACFPDVSRGGLVQRVGVLSDGCEQAVLRLMRVLFDTP